jgi:hypothetical protein
MSVASCPFMMFHGLFRDRKMTGDILISEASRQEVQDLAFPRREFREALIVLVLRLRYTGELSDDPADQAGVQDAFTVDLGLPLDGQDYCVLAVGCLSHDLDILGHGLQAGEGVPRDVRKRFLKDSPECKLRGRR